MEFRELLRQRRLWLGMGAICTVAVVQWTSMHVSASQLRVRTQNGPLQTDIIIGESENAADDLDVVIRNPGGTHILPSDFNDDPFDRDVFMGTMENQLEWQRAEEEYLRGDDAAAERERILQLFQHQPLDTNNDGILDAKNPPPEDAQERERIRRLFQDQPDQTVSSDGILSSGDAVERERIRRLFQDQPQRPAPGMEDYSPEGAAERERIRKLFEDQSIGQRTSRFTSSGCGPSFLAAFDADQLYCPNEGWTFPGLWGGDCPITLCIVKAGANDTFFQRDPAN